jgi:MFS family permease
VFVLLSEYVDTKYRNRYLGIMQAMWGLSMMIISLVFLANNDWRFLTGFMLTISVIVFFTTFMTDESVRFLTSVKGDFINAKHNLNKVARLNSTSQF